MTMKTRAPAKPPPLPPSQRQISQPAVEQVRERAPQLPIHPTDDVPQVGVDPYREVQRRTSRLARGPERPVTIAWLLGQHFLCLMPIGITVILLGITPRIVVSYCFGVLGTSLWLLWHSSTLDWQGRIDNAQHASALPRPHSAKLPLERFENALELTVILAVILTVILVAILCTAGFIYQLSSQS